jgi:dipeptidyl aminopeptidase/acylaminoacyl peptidase
MEEGIHLTEKYERNGWPSIPRPDVKPPEGWSLSLITSVNRVHNHTLSPDGKRLAFIWDRENLSDVYTIASTGGWPQRVTTDRTLVAFWDDELPRWSPDSKWLAFTLADHAHVAPARGGLPRKVSDFAPEAANSAWMPDSQRLIVTVERYDAAQLVLTDRQGRWPHPLTDHPEGDAWDAQPSPDGRWVAYVYRPFDDLNRQDIRVLDMETGSIRSLTQTPQVFNHSPRWNPASSGREPEGRWLAFLSQQTGFYEIWLASENGETHQLTHLGMDVEGIAWSPDGSRLACTVNHLGAYELALVDSATGEVQTLAAGKGRYSLPNWSPKGDFLTVEYEDSLTPPDLYRVDVSTGRVKQLTFSNLPALACLDLVVPEQVSYKSFDGLEVPAFLYRPAKPNGAAVLHPHGGPSGQYDYSWDIFAQYLVAKGYTFLAPNYRGSTGYGRDFERLNHNDWGVGDLQDCLHGARFLAGLPGVDAGRIAIYGGSYGGYMTNCALARDPDHLFACGVSKYGDANLISSWAQCSQRLRLYSEIFLGHPARNRQVYLDGSPIYQVENVERPILVLHGLLDDVVPPQASEEWVEALRRAGKTFEYKTYANDPHGFLRREDQEDVWRRVERFLDWYLLP